MKTFMKNWRPNRMKQFWLHSLLRTYSWVMIVIIASFALLISYVNWDSREKEARQESREFISILALVHQIISIGNWSVRHHPIFLYPFMKISMTFMCAMIL